MQEYRMLTEHFKRLFQKYLPRYIGRRHEFRGTKIKSDGTPQGDLDNLMLAVLRAAILQHFPKDLIFGEEDRLNRERVSEILNDQDRFQWTVDGLDGTGNILLGTNSFGAMVSRRRGNELLYAAVFRPTDEQLRGDGFFYAELGQGAWQWCGEHDRYEQLHTAREGKLDRITVLLEGSSKKFGQPPITELIKHLTTRSSLSCCVAATTVAQGKASALVTIENKPWDNWPAILFIEEAGGIITGWQGNPVAPQHCATIVAAANETDQQQILKILNPQKDSGRN